MKFPVEVRWQVVGETRTKVCRNPKELEKTTQGLKRYRLKPVNHRRSSKKTRFYHNHNGRRQRHHHSSPH